MPNAERILIALRAYLLFLREVELTLLSGEKDAFPATFGVISEVPSNSGTGKVFVEGKLVLPPPRYPDLSRNTDYSMEYLATIGKDDLHRPLPNSVKNRMGTSICETLQLLGEFAGKALLNLNTAVGGYLYFDGRMPHASPESSIITMGTGGRRPSISVVDTLNTFTGVQTRVDTHKSEPEMIGETIAPILLRLLRTIIDGIPRIVPSGIPHANLIEMLASYTLHYDAWICKAAFDALCRIARIRKVDPQNNDWNLSWPNNMPSAAVVHITSV
jgi:hypothetical protein